MKRVVVFKAKIGTETSGLWSHKTGACSIEVHLHVKSIGRKLKRLLKAGACLIQGLLKTGWTVFPLHNIYTQSQNICDQPLLNPKTRVVPVVVRCVVVVVVVDVVVSFATVVVTAN